jgi:hypothetical protein
MVGFMFVLSFGEWLRVMLSPSTQPIQLQFNVVHWFLPFMLHPCLVHLVVHFPHVAFVQVLTHVDL